VNKNAWVQFFTAMIEKLTAASLLFEFAPYHTSFAEMHSFLEFEH
jgi:hypothetical protein